MSEIQKKIMTFVIGWVRQNKTAVPRQEIIKHMEVEGVGFFTTTNAIDSLVHKKYIRKGNIVARKVSYVQLRTF